MARLQNREGWEMQDAGWWTHDEWKVGVTLEHDGKWWVWRQGEPPPPGQGPFKTMREAMEAAKPCAWCMGEREPGEKCACTEQGDS